LSENWNGEEFISSRLDFATAGGKLFKEELQDKWENSASKTYINNLRNNLASHTPFDVRTDNLTLQSFAAFCQKGEEDIDKLEDYLISNEIGDFRIAFSLWGIVFGFANMPKTLTNDLFLSDDLDYVSEVYKYIFKQVHGIELEGKLEKQQYITVQSKMNDVPQSTEEKSNVNDKSEYQNLFDKLSSKFKSIKDNMQKLFIDAFRKSGKSVNELNLLIEKKNLKDIKKEIGMDEKEKSRHQNKEQTLFKPELGKEFYKDENIWYYIEPLLPDDEKTQKQVKTDLYWFQDEYIKGDRSQYYAKARRDNKSVIEYYSKFLEKKRDLKEEWLRKIYKQVDIERIISELKSLYLHNER
jgi:hypothetical protein